MADDNSAVDKGVSFLTALGIALATVISYSAYQSVGWAALHGVLNWLYVIYALYFDIAQFGA